MPHRGKYFCKVGNIKNTENKKELSDFSTEIRIALYSWIILKCCHFCCHSGHSWRKSLGMTGLFPGCNHSHSIVAGGLLKVHQYFAVLTNNRSVGVMGDFRTYDYTLGRRGG